MTKTFTVEAALRCYPTWWRSRYAEEVRSVATDLGAEGRSASSLAFDLVRGAIRVRVRAQGMPTVYRLWATRTRLSIAVATLPWLVVAPLVVMAMGTQSLHSPAGRVVSSGFSFGFAPHNLQLFPTHGRLPTPAPPLTLAGSTVVDAALAIVALFFVTLIVLAFGWSRLTSGIQRSSSPHRRKVSLLAWAPGFALLADIGLVVALIVVHPTVYYSTTGGPVVPLNGSPAAAHALLVALGVVAIVGWLLSIVCVGVATKQADVAPADLRFGRTVSVIVAALLAALLVAYATWGIGLIVQARQAASGSFTTVSYSNQGLWLLMLCVLVSGTVLSVAGARAAVRSWRVISVQFA
jgi:hypothetical protein